MIQERYNQAIELLQQHIKDSDSMQLIGVSTDPTSKEHNGLSLGKLDRESRTVKELESLGFKVIYPAELTDKAVDRMDVAEKYVYDARKSNALIIDGKEQNLSLDLANTISKHFFANGYGMLNGVDKENNSITTYPHGDFKEGATQQFQDLLDGLGFQTQTNEYGNVTVSSDIPYPAVRKSKFEQIYDKAKGKIQGAFAKLKSLVNPKDQVKDNDVNERE